MRMLQSVAKRLVSCVRNSDTVSRQGGDEFVILLSEVACPEDAAFSADKLLAAVAEPHRIAGENLYVTASLGIAVYPADGTDAETLLKRADLALLRAKAHRRGWPPLAMAAATASQVASKICAGEASARRQPVPGTPACQRVVPHHVEVIRAHDVQHPAMQLAQRRDDAVADGRSCLEAEAAIEQALRGLARLGYG